MGETDLISRQAALNAIGDEPLAWTESEYELGLQNQWQSDVDALKALPSAQPEYTGHEESILTMLFGIAKLIIDLQGGYMEMTDGRYFDNNDLFDLAEKLGINY